jgi:hypothetical protein
MKDHIRFDGIISNISSLRKWTNRQRIERIRQVSTLLLCGYTDHHISSIFVSLASVRKQIIHFLESFVWLMCFILKFHFKTPILSRITFKHHVRSFPGVHHEFHDQRDSCLQPTTVNRQQNAHHEYQS